MAPSVLSWRSPETPPWVCLAVTCIYKGRGHGSPGLEAGGMSGVEWEGGFTLRVWVAGGAARKGRPEKREAARVDGV